MDTKILLKEDQIPSHFYNILADLPFQLDPPLHPATRQPISPDDMSAIFPMSLIEQEMSPQREIPIPEKVREAFALYRPTPLIRARRLEQALQTPARIYYKYEGVSPTGSINRIPPSPRQTTINWREPENSLRKLGQGNGEAPWPTPVICLKWNVLYLWLR
jgi:tryptophan synthase beta chain